MRTDGCLKKYIMWEKDQTHLTLTINVGLNRSDAVLRMVKTIRGQGAH